MKKLITSFAALAVLISLAAPSWAASYKLGTHVHIESYEGDGGAWKDWIHCSDVSGANSAPRGLQVDELIEVGATGFFDRIRLSCRVIQSNGSFASGYTLSGYFFDTSYTDATYSSTKTTSNSYLPVGIGGAITQQNSFTFLELPASDIARGESNYDWVPTTAGYSGFNLLYTTTLKCDGGHVLTGVRLKTNDANWPYYGQIITGIKIKCTELETY
jgi:hypothetical protein